MPRRKERIIHSNGYILIWGNGHPYQDHHGRIPEHRVVMEKKIGRYIDPKKEQVHHIDENKQNNNINNLQLLTQAEHTKIHSGWIKKDGKWFKFCGRCGRFLEACKENFYLRKSGLGVGVHVSVCKKCSIEIGRKYKVKKNPRQTSPRS